MSRDLFSFRVELSIRCPRCDRPVYIDGPVLTAHCGSCQADLEIPEDYWIETIGSSCGKMQAARIGEGTGSVLIGRFQGNLTLARFDPYCDECKTDFEDPWDLPPGSTYTCDKCGATYPVSSPPDWLSEGLPRVRELINALFADDASELRSGESTAVPVALSCPECGGSLEVDGTTRFVHCEYCDAQVYIPDGLWLRFHAGGRKRRWFVVCEYAEYDEDG